MERRGAIYHVFARLGEARHEALDTELRGILKEKGLRSEDPFEEVVLESLVLDLQEVREFDRLIQQVSMLLAGKTGRDATTFEHGFTEGTKTGATPVAKGIALPHMHLDDLDQPLLVLVRVRSDFQFVAGDVFGREELTEQVHAAFFLVSPLLDPARHLRMLAQLASRIDQEDFEAMWRAAENEMQLREVFLRDDRYLSLRVGPQELAASWAGLQLRDLRLPEGCLIAAIRRRSATSSREEQRASRRGPPAALRRARRAGRGPHLPWRPHDDARSPALRRGHSVWPRPPSIGQPSSRCTATAMCRASSPRSAWRPCATRACASPVTWPRCSSPGAGASTWARAWRSWHPSLLEAVGLGRRVTVHGLAGAELEQLERAMQVAREATGATVPRITDAPIRPGETGRVDHLWIVSVLTDPVAFPALHDRLYGRQGGPEAVGERPSGRRAATGKQAAQHGPGQPRERRPGHHHGRGAPPVRGAPGDPR